MKTPKNKYTFIDLFAGIGGIRIAFEANNARCVFSSEWDRNCKITYEKNFGDEPFGDITKFKTKKKIPKKFDILTGGFPCQPFSSIGKRQGFKHPTQGTLFFDIVQILKNWQPKAFLLENVPGLKTHDHGNTYKIIKETLRNELGYKLCPYVLDAADYGVPQYRKRLYLVGFSKRLIGNDSFKFIKFKKNKKKIGIGQFIENNPTDRSYSITPHLQKVYMKKLSDGKPELVNKSSKFPVKTLVASYHKIQRLTGTFVEDRNTGMRLLSENECKAIMGFGVYKKLYGKDFIFPVSRTQMYHQLGNSVAIPVVQKISKYMIKTLDKLTNNRKKIKKISS